MINVEGLTKTYGPFTAVDDVTFTARAGQVTGFLGPNGAGKSTTMRVLAGLTSSDRGTATIDGRRIDEYPNPGRHVGILLDASAQHPGRTGREILWLAAKTMGLPESRVDEMLEVVSLDERESKRRVRDYSLGMRQRLGIAQALLGDPKVLILDEPANGLDPAGIRWMRTMLRSYADRGGAVLLSSHLLHEVEQIADEIVMIGRGRIVAAGTKAELLANTATSTLVRSDDDAALVVAIRSAGGTVSQAGDALSVDLTPTEVGRIALGASLALVELRSAATSGLEDMFLELTAATQREDLAVTAPGGASA
ncbi:MAG TPA: ATP-binding cassette domain-containing protein [Acidimicrobiales bacterium]|nr:ATP-binding cassette domain-containing protein [Acidimicrobiales bacterium]